MSTDVEAVSKINGDNGYPTNFFRLNELVHCGSGLWIFEKKASSASQAILRNVYSFIVHFMSFSFLVLECVMFKETVKDTEQFISQFGMMVPTLLAYIKTITLRVKHKKITKVLDTLQDKRFCYEEVGDFKPGKTLFEARRQSQKFCKLLLSLYMVVGLFACACTIVNIYSAKDFYTDVDITCYDFQLYYFYIPFPVDSREACVGVSLFSGIALLGYSFITASYDTFYASLLIFINGQFLILGEAIKTIRQRVLKRLNLPEDLEVLRDEDVPELEGELYREMSRVTEHLIMLLGAADDIEDIFNMAILMQVTVSLITFASVLFMATTGRDIIHALYQCDWFSASRRFKSTLLVTMCRLQKPIYMSFGKFCPLTIDSLVSIVKSSFSYYTVFKRFNE